MYTSKHLENALPPGKLPKYELYFYYTIFAISFLYMWSSAKYNGDYCFLISLLSVTIFDRAFYVIIHHAFIEIVRSINTKVRLAFNLFEKKYILPF